MENKSTKKPFNFNYLSVVFIYIWAIAFLVMIPKIKEPDSRLFPYIISITSIVLATILLVKTHFNLGKKEEPLNFSGSKTAMLMAALLLAYIGAIEVVGFYISTPFYVFITMWALGQRNKKLMIIISISMSLGVYLFFDVLLDMMIPTGVLLQNLL